LLKRLRAIRNMPIIVWSHGNGGNVHDHAMLLAQLAVEVPAIVIAPTHTDGSADVRVMKRTQTKTRFYYHRPIEEPSSLHQLAADELRMYQKVSRQNEITQLLKLITDGTETSRRVILAGFDFGGSTVNDMLDLGDAMNCELVGRLILDPTGGEAVVVPSIPTTVIVSQDWMIEPSSSMNVKNASHHNLTEIAFCVPQFVAVFLLRLTGMVHRRGNPRKTYRRVSKMIIEIVHQFLQNHS
jgi:hypothetical protein